MKLNERAALVYLTMPGWNGTHVDGEVSDEVTETKAAERSAGRFQKNLLDAKHPAVRKLRAVRNEARAYHHNHTLPWSDDGWRLRPARGLTGYLKRLGDLRRDHDQALREMADAWAEIMERGRAIQGDMYDASEYPTADEIVKRFSFEVEVRPLPVKGDFRIELNKDEIEYLGDQIRDKEAERVKLGVKSIYSQMQQHVGHLARKLAEFGNEIAGSDRKSYFKDSAIQNLRSLMTRVAELNVTDDPEIDAIRQEIEDMLSGIDAKVLRESEPERKAVKETAEQIMAKMKAFY